MKQQIEALISLAKDIQEEWQQGRLLLTREMAKWSELAKQEADDNEKHRVFTGFSAADQGRSRRPVAMCESEKQAAYIAAANPAALLPILELALKGLEHSAGVSGDASGAAEAAAPGADARDAARYRKARTMPLVLDPTRIVPSRPDKFDQMIDAAIKGTSHDR